MMRLFVCALALRSVSASSRMTLCESIPTTELEEITLTPGAANTWEAQVAVCDGATSTLDVSMMYENLLAESDVPHASWFNSSLESLGAGRGKAVFDAIARAQSRGVKVRLLASPMGGTASCSLVRALNATPARFEYAQWDPKAWYGGGIMHMKLWIADDDDVYVGSANMDWASLAQVKEFGVRVEDAAVAKDAKLLFETFWSMARRDVETTSAFDRRVAHERTVPTWSEIVDVDERTMNPFDAYGSPWNLSVPLRGSGFGSSSLFLSAAPPEVVGTRGRMADSDAIVATLDDANSSISMAVMDFLPASAYNDGGFVSGGATKACFNGSSTLECLAIIFFSTTKSIRPPRP